MKVENARRIYETIKKNPPYEEYASEIEQRRADVIISLGDYIVELEQQVAAFQYEIKQWARWEKK